MVVIAVGLFFVRQGRQAKFRDELEPGGVGPFSHESIVALGRVGWVGRGVVMGLVGWFLIRAAVRFRPDEAKGIDGALREVTGSTLGAVLVGFAAVALVALRRVLRRLGAAPATHRRRLTEAAVRCR